MTNIKSLQNQMPENVFGLLMQLAKVKGTKDIFQEFGLKALDKAGELSMLSEGITNINTEIVKKKFYQEFSQLKTMFEGQITMYQTMVDGAEGFMKQMAEMQLQTAKSSLDMSIQNYLPQVKEILSSELGEIEGIEALIQENVTDFSFDKLIKATEKSIEDRYTGEEEAAEEPKKEVTVTKAKVIPTRQGVKTEVISEEKVEIPQEETEEERKARELDEQIAEEERMHDLKMKAKKERAEREAKEKAEKEAKEKEVKEKAEKEAKEKELAEKELQEANKKSDEISINDNEGGLSAIEGFDDIGGLGDIGGLDDIGGLGDIGGLDDISGLGDIGDLEGGFPEGLEMGGFEGTDEDLSNMMSEFMDDEPVNNF